MAGASQVSREAVREALLRRVEGYIRDSFAHLDDRALVEAVAAATPAETVARVLTAVPEVGLEPDGWTKALLRGAAAKQEMLARAGGALTAGQVAELFGVTPEAVKQRVRRGRLLAVPLSGGEWGVPARQFREDGRVRAGIPDVLAAFGGEDPWVILSVLVGPNPLTGEQLAMEALDDPAAITAVAELARTYGAQGAA